MVEESIPNSSSASDDAPTSNCRFLPAGQFWVIESAGGTSKSNAAQKKAIPGGEAPPITVNLNLLSSCKVDSTSRAWLSEANPEIFDRWESSLDEIKKDLIEAYAWTTFKTSIDTGSSAVVDRKDLLTRIKDLR